MEWTAEDVAHNLRCTERYNRDQAFAAGDYTELRKLFGPTSSVAAVSKFHREQPEEYARLRQIAKDINLIR